MSPKHLKLYIFSLNTTVYLQIPVEQKQPFSLLFGFFKGFLICICKKSSVIKSFPKNPGEINLNKTDNLVYVFSQMKSKLSICGSTRKIYVGFLVCQISGTSDNESA